MSPDFTPKESEKKRRESRETSTPKSAEGLANRIAEDYRLRHERSSSVRESKQQSQGKDDGRRETGGLEKQSERARDIRKPHLSESDRSGLSPAERGPRGDSGSTAKRVVDSSCPSDVERRAASIGRRFGERQHSEALKEGARVLGRFTNTEQQSMSLGAKAIAERVSDAIGRQFGGKSYPEDKSAGGRWTKEAPIDGIVKTPREEGRGLPDSQSLSLARHPTPNEVDDSESRVAGKLHKVKMHVPVIRGESLQDAEQLKRYVDKELSGMKHNPNFEDRWHDAEAHLKLWAAFGSRRDARLNEVLEMARALNLPSRTARNYVFDTGRPELFEHAENAITRSEASAILTSLRGRMNGVDSTDEMVLRLKAHDQWQHVQSWKKFDRDFDLSVKYFRFLDVLSEGGTLRDSALRTRIDDSLALTWLRGVHPNLVRRAIELPRVPAGQEAARILPEKGSLTTVRHGGRILMTRPEVRGVHVTSSDHLQHIITDDFPGIKEHPRYPKWWHEACAHIELYTHLSGREFLNYGEARELAKRFGMKLGTVNVYVKRQGTPRLFQQMNDCISKSEAAVQIERIRKRNNGVMSVQDFDARFSNLYGADQVRAFRSYAREQALMTRYFRFLDRYQQGGAFDDIARRTGIPSSSGREILEGTQPVLVRIASRIPADPPRTGYLWLPTKMTDGRYPSGFVQVPERITSHRDVLAAVRQLRSLDNDTMAGWRAKYGNCEKGDALMYLLGLYVTDGAAFNQTILSKSMGIRLSKGYDWSLDVGDGMCYYLGLLGVQAHRVKDTAPKTVSIKINGQERPVHQKGKHNWASENSPLIQWVHRSCLGLSDELPKKEQDLTADWILKSPESMRRAFLQGMGDGDGSASAKGQYLCISMVNNHDFISALLGTFGVTTRRTTCDVITKGHEAARTAAAIPMFRFASGRLEASERVLRRVEFARHVREQPLNPEELDFISSMHSRGMSEWEISEAFLDRFGSAVDERAIGRRVRHLKHWRE